MYESCGSCTSYNCGWCSTRDIPTCPTGNPDLGDYCGCPYYDKKENKKDEYDEYDY